MVYRERFVTVVKCNGKILRERDGDNVYIPFGSEYSLLLKNLESRKALVKIEIDGQDIGNQLIINPNSSVELERFLGDLNSGNRFKFIQKTEEIANHRGDRLEDGLIRVEVKFEVPFPVFRGGLISSPPMTFYGGCGGGPRYGMGASGSGDVNLLGNLTITNSIGGSVNCASVSFSSNSVPNSEEGITVPGAVSNQKFQHGYIGQLETNSVVIVLRLRGCVEDNKPVQKPLTVSTKVQCSICGRFHRSDKRFCSNCGSYLT